MEIVLHDDVERFAGTAIPLYSTDPQRHTMALTVLDGLVRTGERAAVLLTLEARGAVRGALLRCFGRPALVSGSPPEAAGAVVDALLRADLELRAVTGPAPEVEAFVAAHRAVTGASPHVDLSMRLFALGTLLPPEGVPGAARPATAADLDLLAAWRAGFTADAKVGSRDPDDPRESVARSLRLGTGEILWEVNGTPVAQASARRPVAGMSRIGPVYTAPEHRRHGYAAAVTAAASRWALDAGARRVLLFTDVANPTTNTLYPRLGFRPVHDAFEVTLTPRRRPSCR